METDTKSGPTIFFFLDKTIYQELGILPKNYDDKIDHKWGG